MSMNLFNLLRRRTGSAPVARERLQILLAHERAAVGDSDLVAKRLAPCLMVYCAAPSFLNRQGEPKTVKAEIELRAAP